MGGLKTNQKLVSRLPTELDILEFIDELMPSGLSVNDAIVLEE